ncbi:flagellar protein FlaG [Pseudomonas putida]|jgi:flagellar protein FlaG|uniref:Flagellin FlaG n=1 Tax=Pseudomonas taiwanensis SJ9 TaxID=1388762 RepID=V7DDR9_9PSED|nr:MULTISPECIES: flagellar protein FlaG [Pseudomonas]MDY4309515.1 flagellar protein FlaG [Pseudomonas putida]ESW40469.1 flagellin FlaG [Pseudomonas taiwanensis SJ9]MBF8788839.1 flagellar protein FlaG [Pseudomonas asiatica]MDY4318910.1 flagellar protein FlaG [Pseudomonas putida]MDY4352295.1 flagellar protein FlaG [Pseudomonas putida]
MDMSVKLGLSYPASAAPDTTSSKRQAGEQAANESVAKESKPVAREELETAVSAIQDFVKASERQLDFSIDDSTGQVVVKVIARQSGEVIRQLPSEVALKLAKNLKDANSLLFDIQA